MILLFVLKTAANRTIKAQISSVIVRHLKKENHPQVVFVQIV